jgi:hypothetical protein
LRKLYQILENPNILRFKDLILKSKAAKEGFVKCVKFAVDQEMKALKQADLFLTSKNCSIFSLEENKRVAT